MVQVCQHFKPEFEYWQVGRQVGWQVGGETINVEIFFYRIVFTDSHSLSPVAEASDGRDPDEDEEVGVDLWIDEGEAGGDDGEEKNLKIVGTFVMKRHETFSTKYGTVFNKNGPFFVICCLFQTNINTFLSTNLCEQVSIQHVVLRF